MKAKATDEDGGVETVVGVRPALKSFLHQVISDQQECNKGGLGPGLGPLGLNGKRTVSALSRLIELPNLDAKKEPPSPPAKPKNNVNKNNKNVRGHERLERKAAVLLPDKPAVEAVEPAPFSKPASATAVATAAAATPNGAGQRTKTVTDDWWRERASRPGATAVASSLRREALSRKSSDADGRRGASPARKPSFKVAAHRTKSRTHTPAVTAAVKVTIPSTRSSRVQALATKFNSMEETTPPTSPTSPSPAPDIKIIVGNRAGVLKSVSPAIMDEVKALSDKIHHLQDLQDKQSKVALVRKRPSFAKSRVAANGNKVKAAVKIFEHGPGETATQTTKSRPTTQDGATQTPPAVDPAATNGLTRGAGAAEETAISDVPKKEETSRRKPQRPVSPVSPGARRVREETLADKALADKARRSYNHKVMLKTSKSVLSENSSKRLVVVNFDDDDIDAIPPLPSTPPPDQRPATTTSSTPVMDILARAVSPVPLPVTSEVTARKLPPPGEVANEKEPPVAPALPERNTLAEEDDEEAMNAKIQANRSFLWRPAPPVPQQSKRKDTDDGPSFRAVPALIEPDVVEVPQAGQDDNPELDDDPHELYDDVVSPTDENIYDDIGVDVKKPDEQPQQEMYETCGGGNYDDCEGEGYQFVDSAGQQGPALAAGPAQASPQRVATTLEEEDETEDNIYDDVLSERRPPSPPAPVEADDAVSTSGVYEAIYLVRPKGQRGPPPSRRLPLLPPGVPGRGLGVGRHGSSCSSSSSSRSSSAGNASSYCGKINSIYGESLTDEQAMAVAAVLELPFEPGAVQAARVPLSETSDEWVDLDNTPTDQEDQDDEETIVVFRDQPRRRRATSWSRKVRTQRTRSPRRRGDVSTDSDNENPYESLYENPDAIDDIDSFDSDSDEEGHHTSHPHHEPGISNLQNGKLPDVPPRENIYGVHVMRFKEAAGKKMQKIAKNWSLRKNDISNKLSRMRRKSSVDPRGAAALSVPESSPPRTPPMGKSQSSNQLAGNKYWSFKSKFKRSQSTSTSLGSTFYLTEELVVGNESSSSVSQVDSNSTYTDSASPASQRSGPPSNILPLPLPPRPPSATSQQNYINERRNSGAVRPNSPPPPPPPVPKRNGPQKDRDKTKSSSSSWYAECGLFDSSNLDSIKRAQKEDPLNTSLYAEAGLWDNVPPPSSSPYDSSQSEHDASQTTDYSDSSAGHTGPLFSDEPLYQFYNASVFEQARREEAAEGDSDGYEEIVDGIVKTTRPSAMELIRPREGKHRTLWCEIPEVKESGVLDSLSAHEKKLQESKFELITSEASYVKSLIVLEKHFMNSVEFRDESILSKGDRRILFSNVNPVRTRSEKFLADMEHCWQDSIMLQGICDIVKRHASEYFNVYTKYCTNQIYLDRTLKKLREGDSRFSEALLHLESSPECQSLSLHSFLMLPMQRITRLRLLLDAVLKRLTPEHDEYNSCQQACASLNKVVNECNEGARKMERYEEMMLLSRQLEFSQTVKPVPIISAARWLVKSGALTQMIWRNDDAKLTFGRKVNKITVHLFLFTDILVITKRKSEDVYSVVDYCPRNLVQMSSMEDLPQPQQLQLQPPLKGGAGGRNLVLLTMLQNQETKTVEMVLSCGSESDRERWLAAVSPPKSDNPNEQLYEIWDCPQVRSEHPYAAQQPDELSLDVGDVVNVLRKTKDGWYEGERIRDREKGWFPANYTVEIASAHIRAKNLKQRHRFLILSGSYLQESRSKNK